MMRQLRIFFLGASSELKYKKGKKEPREEDDKILVLHHLIRPGKGRPQTIWDGQLRGKKQEFKEHEKNAAGNGPDSLPAQVAGNEMLYGKLLDYKSRDLFLFSAEVERAIDKWIEFYPQWVQEAAKKSVLRKRAVILRIISRENGLKRRRCKQLLREYLKEYPKASSF